MHLNQQDCERVLTHMSNQEQMVFLARFGHHMTIIGREAYEFQGSGVTSPRWLRDLNELYHRIFSQIRGLAAEGKKDFPADALAAWICGEGKSEEFRAACLDAIESCLASANKKAAPSD